MYVGPEVDPAEGVMMTAVCGPETEVPAGPPPPPHDVNNPDAATIAANIAFEAIVPHENTCCMTRELRDRAPVYWPTASFAVPRFDLSTLSLAASTSFNALYFAATACISALIDCSQVAPARLLFADRLRN